VTLSVSSLVERGNFPILKNQMPAPDVVANAVRNMFE